MPEWPILLGEPTTVDIPSGTADIVCGRRAEESDKLGDLLRGNKLLRRLFLGQKLLCCQFVREVVIRNASINLLLD